MYWILLLTFILGYLLIATEHLLRVDKAASAILTGVLCWTILVIGRTTLLPAPVAGPEASEELLLLLDHALLERVGEIAEILFFLLGAMTIVELIDAHQGFEVITGRITTTSRRKLLWTISLITFFLSAVLDNLTTAIVMAALLRKLLPQREDQFLFGGAVIIAANAGGAWSPIGDVTTIMLWINGQVTAWPIIRAIFLPGLLSLLVPLLLLSRQMRGVVPRSAAPHEPLSGGPEIRRFEQQLIFWMGIGGLLFVPIFKNLSHLPPFMGMLLSLGAIWIATGIVHRKMARPPESELSVGAVIRRIDTPSILFFLGILLAVAALQTSGHLEHLATALDHYLGDIYLINAAIGLLSAVVDNVPLVAGAIGMYPSSTYPPDASFWQLLAYCAGTGGSILIIGSAAGVAIMGLLKIDFIWYLKKISLPALFGYLAGLFLLYFMHK